ncbi:pre-rRNA-processing protein TSR1 isoform X2 [Aphelenchoides avenae]|nr:pre-rRNA-processing protein TSR1 isoform X2 [Aphelenchus avenae]
MSEKPQTYRPSAFKLPNKKHKTGQHRSKREISRDTKGKKDVKALTIRRNHSLSRNERRNQMQQAREQKRDALLTKHRQQGGTYRPPLLTTILSFNVDLGPVNVIRQFLTADSEGSATDSKRGNISYLSLPRFKSRYGLVCPDPENVDNVLDCLKVSDVLVIIWPINHELSSKEQTLLTTAMAHGLPTTVHVTAGLPISGKQRDHLRKGLRGRMQEWNFGDEKVHDLDNASDALQLLRQIAEMKKRPTILQQRRPHLMVERMEMDNLQSGTCTLKLTGYVRGTPLNVNKLVHVQGWGDFQVARIDEEEDPHSLKGPARGMREFKAIVADPHKQTGLDSEIIPDPMDAEQPDVDDDSVTTQKLAQPKIRKRVPKGTSDYQAAWIIDDDDEANTDEKDAEEDNESDEEEDDDMLTDPEDDNEQEDDEDEYKTARSVIMEGSQAETEGMMEDDEMDMEEVEKYRQEREDAQWPDEVDTPHNVPARERFQKYRGMKSFRTSPWDPKENLPVDYARIFKFANFKRTKKLVLNGIEEEYSDEHSSDVVLPGAYVTLHLRNVPAHLAEDFGPHTPMVVYGLLPHEHRMSVLNVVLKRHPGSKVPIKNKQNLIFHVGYRRFEANPLFSQHTNGDKFKMERFMPAEGAFVATVFAPIMFPPCPVLVFRRDAKGRQHLVASGAVLDINPDRIVLKRIVLSGHPFKINKCTATVRFMFFNKEDVDWFKPVEVYTGRGRRGHIKESLGTHGLMKCVFDQPLTVQDAVLMNLYKRAFPQWTYNARVERTQSTNNEGMLSSAISEIALDKANDTEMHE